MAGIYASALYRCQLLFFIVPRLPHAKIGSVLNSKQIGDKLKQIRLKKFGENVREFERQSRVSRGSVPDIESGDSVPMVDTFQKWLIACDVNFSEFFDEPNPKNPYKPQFKKYHDQLEYVLRQRGTKESSTLATLRDEHALLLAQSRDKPSPDTGRRAAQSHEATDNKKSEIA